MNESNAVVRSKERDKKNWPQITKKSEEGNPGATNEKCLQKITKA